MVNTDHSSNVVSNALVSNLVTYTITKTQSFTLVGIRVTKASIEISIKGRSELSCFVITERFRLATNLLLKEAPRRMWTPITTFNTRINKHGSEELKMSRIKVTYLMRWSLKKQELAFSSTFTPASRGTAIARDAKVRLEQTIVALLGVQNLPRLRGKTTQQ